MSTNETRPTAHTCSWGWNGDMCAVWGVAIVLGGDHGSKSANHKVQEKRASLIADAFNTYHKTGKMPSELEAENATMRAGLQWLAECADPDKLDGKFAITHAKRTLAALTQPPATGE